MLLMKASLVERPTWAVLDFSQEWNFFPWEICSDFWKYRFFKQKKYERFRARHSIKENSPRHERGTKKDIPVPMKNGIRDYLNPLLLYDTSLSSDKLNHAEKKKYCWWRTYFVCRWWVRAFFHVQCIVWRKLRTFFLFLQKRLFMSRIVFWTNAFLSMKLIAVDILMRRACSESVIFLLSVIAHRSKVSMILLPK